jgi:hypothetical protein
MRWERTESTRLAWAFVLSLVFHLLAYGVYETGQRLHIWQRMQWPAWMVAPKMLAQLLIKPQTAREREQLEKQRQEQQRREQTPFTFVDVSPAQATPEPPQKALYYSALNSQAANRDAVIKSEIPKIDGKRTEVAKTEDVPREKAFPLRPSPPPAPSAPAQPKPQPEVKPKPALDPKPEPAEVVKPKTVVTPGDLTLVRPEDLAHKTEVKPEVAKEVKPKSAPARPDESSDKGEAKAEPHKRVRRLSDLPPEKRMAALAGEKMRQEGGVRRHGLVSLDVVASPFGNYDRDLIYAVQERWYSLLDEHGFAGERTGKVTLRFHLNQDGSVTAMNLVENTVDLTLALLCQSAIHDPAPFAPWPTEMRREIGAKYREVTFTFYYTR